MWKNRDAPCIGCKDRFPKCHSTCDKFKEFRKNVDELREEIQKDYYIENILIRDKTKSKYGLK